MAFSDQETKARAATRKRTPARGFGGQQQGRSSPSQSQPEPSEAASPTGLEEDEVEEGRADVGQEQVSVTSDLFNPEYWVQQGLQAGVKVAPLYIAGMAQGLTAQLLLRPEETWQAATNLLPSPAPLSLEQQQQQTQRFLLEAMQAEFSSEELSRLPDEMRVVIGMPALPGADAELLTGLQSAVETTASAVICEGKPESTGSEVASEDEPSQTTEPQPQE